MPDAFSNPFRTGDYNPDQAREVVRGAVAIIAVAVFLTVILFYLCSAMRSSDPSWSHVKEAMQAILPAVTSVLGTVLGFYFGSQKS